MRNCYIVILLCCVLSFLLPMEGRAQDEYIRLKGYYRTYQYTDSVLTHVVDGMMEFFIPVDGKGEFADRKFLGERLQTDGSDETLLRIALPNLEVTPLINSIDGEEYSQRNNGDIYLLDKKAGNISRSCDEIEIFLDELTGRPNHELDMSQLKLAGVDARMIVFDERERYNMNKNKNKTTSYLDLSSSHKHQAFIFRFVDADKRHQADVFSEFYVTDRAVISKQDKRKIMRQKNKIQNFKVPDSVPPLPKKI